MRSTSQGSLALPSTRRARRRDRQRGWPGVVRMDALFGGSVILGGW